MSSPDRNPTSDTWTSATVIDEAVLEAARAEFGAALFEQLLDTLFEETDELLSALDDAANRADAEDSVRLFHAIRGGVSNFGMIGVATLVARLEIAARSGRSPDSAEVARIRSVWENARSAVVSRLA